MKSYTFLFIIALLSGPAITGRAQSFEADSVYYTPIPKEYAKQTRKTVPLPIFRDTTKNDKKIEYFFNVQVGSLIGCNDCGTKEVMFTASTLHGVTLRKKLRAGIGVGFDSYDSWQTLPIYGSVSWDLLGTKNTQALFVQFDYGWSKAWKNLPVAEYGLADDTGGKTYNAIAGYRIRYHDVKIGLSVGSKFQEVTSYYEFPSYVFSEDGIWVEGPPSTSAVRRSMKRLMVSLTIGWK